jgi:hypothetical protein
VSLDDGSWLARLRSSISGLDLLVGLLLALILIPLIVGPFIVVLQFLIKGAYLEALLVGGLFTACVRLALRAVRRGEWGPGTLGIGSGAAVADGVFGSEAS